MDATHRSGLPNDHVLLNRSHTKLSLVPYNAVVALELVTTASTVESTHSIIDFVKNTIDTHNKYQLVARRGEVQGGTPFTNVD